MDSTIDTIKALLRQQNKSQKDLANYLGIPPQKVSNWMTGVVKSYQKYLTQIAAFLNVSVDVLLAPPQNATYGSELQKMIAQSSEILEVPYDTLVSIYQNKESPRELNMANLLHHFKYYLGLYPASYYSGYAFSTDCEDSESNYNEPSELAEKHHPISSTSFEAGALYSIIEDLSACSPDKLAKLLGYAQALLDAAKSEQATSKEQ